MDSTGIGVLIGRYKNLIRKNKKTYISNPNKTIEKIFNMSGLFEIMPKIS
jgi:stage II sporulation protein AA (anti-sigma F factor antagonist)